MYSYTILALASLASAAIMPAGPQFLNHRNETAVTTTKVVSAYTTFCPEPTTFELGGKTYEVAEPTTLTITDCPCTIVEPCYTCDVGPTGTGTAGPSSPTPGPPGPTVTGTPGPSPPNPGPSGPPAPPGTTETPGEGEPMPPPLTGAAGKNGIALVGAAVFGMLAL